MVANLKISSETEIFYPSEDDEPLAETHEHLLAIVNTFTFLTQYLAGQQAMVFSNQFLYYVEGLPSARVAPDIIASATLVRTLKLRHVPPTHAKLENFSFVCEYDF